MKPCDYCGLPHADPIGFLVCKDTQIRLLKEALIGQITGSPCGDACAHHEGSRAGYHYCSDCEKRIKIALGELKQT